jgi:hypothetical protein
MQTVRRWWRNWRQRNPYRYGSDKHRSAWEATQSDTDLLRVMIEQNNRRASLPKKGVLP